MSTISLGVSSTTNVVTLVLEPQNTLSISTVGSVTPTSILDLTDVNASSITNGQVLVFDSGTGTFIPGDAAGSDTNIGNTDQTLAGVRDVEMAGNNLTFSNSDTVVHTISPAGATFNRGITVSGTTTAGGSITLKEDTDNGTDGVKLSAPAALGSSLALTLPSADGSAGHFLKTDGSGNLSFAADNNDNTSLANTDQVLTGNRVVDIDGGSLSIFDVTNENTSSLNMRLHNHRLRANGNDIQIGYHAAEEGVATSGSIKFFPKDTTNGGIQSANLDRASGVDGALTLANLEGTGGLVLSGHQTAATYGVFIASDGSVDFRAYGSGTFTGTAAKLLAVDSSGNVIEENVVSAGLGNVVEDTTPQLGGALDTNGNAIQFRDTGDTNYVELKASATEPASNVTFFLPIADGTASQVLETNGSGRLSFATRATEEYVDTAANTLTKNTQTGTTYTPVLTDAGKMITCDNASAITVTIPTNASVAYEQGTVLSFIQKGAGQVTLAGDTGVTLNNANGLKTASQYSVISCWKEDNATWVVYGDTTS